MLQECIFLEITAKVWEVQLPHENAGWRPSASCKGSMTTVLRVEIIKFERKQQKTYNAEHAHYAHQANSTPQPLTVLTRIPPCARGKGHRMWSIHETCHPTASGFGHSSSGILGSFRAATCETRVYNRAYLFLHILRRP